MEQLLFSINATAPIFFVMVIGYILRRAKMMDEPTIKTLNKLNYRLDCYYMNLFHKILYFYTFLLLYLKTGMYQATYIYNQYLLLLL